MVIRPPAAYFNHFGQYLPNLEAMSPSLISIHRAYSVRTAVIVGQSIHIIRCRLSELFPNKLLEAPGIEFDMLQYNGPFGCSYWQCARSV